MPTSPLTETASPDGNAGPIAYIARTRAYYQALGYPTPYVWAHQETVALARLKQALAASRITLVTTAAPYQPDKGDQGPGAPYNAAAKFYQVYSGDTAVDHDLRIAHVAIDRRHTRMTDSGTWFPLPLMRRLAAAGSFLLAPRFHGFPTNRSQRQTIDVDAPDLLARCLADRVDAALLVANCPVCHQSLSLAASLLESHGIATVLLGCARDVVEYCGAPRFLFSDFPLGNAAGRPGDPESQAITLRLALDLLQQASTARTTWQSPLSWPGPADWKDFYANPQHLAPDELKRLRDAAEDARLTAKALRASSLSPNFCSL